MDRVSELLLASKLLGLLDRAKQEEENRKMPLPIPILGGLSINIDQAVAEKYGIRRQSDEELARMVDKS